MNVIVNKWDQYKFDFENMCLNLKFKVILSLQQNHHSINEVDLYSIFEEYYSYLMIEVILFYFYFLKSNRKIN